jgi:hypothetical protein
MRLLPKLIHGFSNGMTLKAAKAKHPKTQQNLRSCRNIMEDMGDTKHNNKQNWSKRSSTFPTFTQNKQELIRLTRALF